MKSKRSLSTLLTISLTASVIIVATVIIIFNYYRNVSNSRIGLEQRADEYIKVLAGSLEIPLWHFEKQTVVNMGTAFSLNDLVVSLSVKDANHEEFLVIKKEHRGEYIERSADIQYHGEYAGTVTIALSVEHYSEVNRRLLTSNIIIVLSVIVFLIVTTKLILRYFLSKPLEGLNSLAEAYASADYDYGLKDETYKEFQQVTATMQLLGEKITNQVKTIQATEAKYRSIFENAIEGIYRVSADQKEINVNPAMAETLGYNSAQHLLASMDKIINEAFSSPREFQDLLEQIRNEKTILNLEKKLKKPNGDDVWISLNGRSIYNPDGTLAHYEGSLINITMRKKAEDESFALRQYLNSVIDSMPSILVGIDANAKITFWNKQAEAQTGIPSNNARGRIITELFPNLSRQLGAYTMAIKDNNPKSFEKIPQPHNGEIEYLDMLIYPLILENRQEAVVRVDDVTQRVKMEQVMIQTEKLISVGGLAAGMAHEINNPLGGIMLGIQNIQRRLAPDIEANMKVAHQCNFQMPDLQAYLDQRKITNILDGMRTSIIRASDIISNMLHFSRKSESKMMSNNLNEICDRAILLADNDYDLTKKYDFRDIRVNREYDSNLKQVICNETEIEQVILNLLRNSTQAMAEMEGHCEKTITIRTTNQKSAVQLEIVDSGPGMEESVRQRIFEPFFTTKPAGSGTGLGLSVSYMIIANNHQGTFKVESEPGKGSHFIIQLPLIRYED
ncbi:PAS domain S-box protein [bacterium]|nr:PAS domain S-box protein [bacterium]